MTFSVLPPFEEFDFTSKKIRKYKFNNKVGNELERRIKLGENIIVPKKFGKYSFWDGNIKLNSDEIEILFKKI